MSLTIKEILFGGSSKEDMVKAEEQAKAYSGSTGAAIGQISTAGWGATQSVATGVTLSHSLTDEEKKELEELKRERSVTIKASKLEIFKKTPRELRQKVIDQIVWNETVGQMDMVDYSVPNNQRLTDLELKEGLSSLGQVKFTPSYWPQGSAGSQWYGTDTRFADAMRLPSGLTAEDLKKAHVEATLEEEILNEK